MEKVEDMKYDLSIVVPVYGAEKYIKGCVDSILDQTKKDIEVILVNDCSPDKSMEVCEELYGNNERVRLLNQPRNMGAGAARNAGIKAATGRYIGFVDADDQVQPEMFETMYRLAEEYDADVVHNTGFVMAIPAEGDIVPIDLLDPEKNLTYTFDVDIQGHKEITLLNDNLEERFKGWLSHKYHWAVWNQIYKRDFLQKYDIQFSDMRLAEDEVFAIQVLFRAERFVVNPGGWYVYRPSQSSVSRSGDSFKSTVNAIESQVKGVKAMRAALEKIPFFQDNPENLRKAVYRMVYGLEEGYIRADYQRLGEERMVSDELLHNYFVKEFGEKAEYVEFLFQELLRNYPPYLDVVTGMFSDPKVWAVIRKSYKEYKRTGDSSILWEGLKNYYES